MPTSQENEPLESRFVWNFNRVPLNGKRVGGHNKRNLKFEIRSRSELACCRVLPPTFITRIHKYVVYLCVFKCMLVILSFDENSKVGVWRPW